LGTQRTVVASSDLAGRVLDRESFTTNPDSDKTLKRIIDCCRKLMRKKDARIEGIGISLPGLVDHESGIVHFIPHFKWRSWPVAEKVRKATGVPVTVDNDANAASLAELWFGLPEIRDSRDFIMVLVEEGLGTGVVFDGQVYHGEAGAAGEFGHTTIGTGAPTTCAGGSRECWEAFASERAALARYKILKADSADQTSFDQLVKQALDGDQVASEALLETAHYIGVGIANLLAGLSPSTVIVGGIIARAWPLIADRLKKAVEENSICRGLPSARIVASTLGDNPQLMGALSLVLALKFASRDIS
jgi:predicted NBD/HSP70 family sugar kinase